MPPRAGPTLRVMLKPILFRATAAGRSLRGTMSPTEACQEGLLSAVPLPIRNVKNSSDHGETCPTKAKIASKIETVSMKNCDSSMTLRRSKLSATAPESNESSITGRVLDA